MKSVKATCIHGRNLVILALGIKLLGGRFMVHELAYWLVVVEVFCVF